jgi:tRNA nucleotidyltransferase (CCA-adding enzyme)
MPVIEVPEKIQCIMEIMEKSGYEICAVGGCVRDSLLGRTIHDWDLCTSAEPDETESVFSKAGFSTIPTGKKHGTITVLWNREPIEITTYRIDGTYTDSRRPDNVTFTRTLEEDLSRRDFTVNAMACGRDGKVIDLFDGQKDLQEKRIRCVGVPQMRFQEDTLRILRALRFAARLGFQLEEKTAAAVMEGKERLALISPERIWAELTGFLLGKYAAPLVKDFYPVLAASLGMKPPYGKGDWIAAAECLAFSTPDGWTDWMVMTARFCLLLWKGAFPGFPDAGEKARDCCIALRTDKDSRSRVAFLVEQVEKPIPQTVPELRRMIGGFGMDAVSQLIFMWEAGGVIDKSEILHLWEQSEAILQREDCIRIGQLAIGGKELQKLGIPSGPEIGKILHDLLEEVINDILPNEKDALENWVLQKLK